MEIPFLKELFIIFSLSIVVIYVCNRVKIPVLVGFLITGVICGPYGFGLVGALDQVETLAQIGIVLLLFSIGMELHLDMLIRLKKYVLIGGNAQALLTIGAGLVGTLILGSSVPRGVFAGFLITLSSTAIVLQHFQQKGQMDSPQGHICLAILIYQDLIVVPMVLLIPILAGGGENSFEPQMLLSAVIAMAVIAGGFLAARKLVPIILKSVVHTKSRELFNITILALGLAVAMLTSSMGLSLALGAFLAGIILAESEYSQNALEGIMPFKDIFTSLFFISVGMLLNTLFAFEHIGLVLALALMIIIVKAIITTGVTKLLGYPWRIAIITGIAISQVGEFSFVLAKEGVDHKLMSPDHYQLFLAASILTMAMAPFLLKASPAIARRISLLIVPDRGIHAPARKPKVELEDHLIIIGFGVAGKYLARAAVGAGIKYVILEMNPDTVTEYAAKGEPIRFGDGSHPGMLRALNVEKARIMAVVISDQPAVRGVVRAARRLNSNLHILARTAFMDDVELLHEVGANDVIPEEFETALEMFARVLSYYFVPKQEIDRRIEEVRTENYRNIREINGSNRLFMDLEGKIQGVDVNTLIVNAASMLAGKTLAQCALRQRLDLTIVAVLREEEMHTNPGGDFKLEAGDVAYLFGPADKLLQATAIFKGEGSIA